MGLKCITQPVEQPKINNFRFLTIKKVKVCRLLHSCLKTTCQISQYYFYHYFYAQ